MTFNNNTPSNFFDASANARASSSPFVDVFQPRDPTTADITSETSINNYPIQKKWLNTATNTLWELKSFDTSNGITTANWIKIGGSNIVETLTGNSGGAVGPDGSNNINVVGDGTYITTVGTPLNNTLTIEPAGGLATLYTEDTGTASAMAGNLNVFGTGGIATTGSGNTITIDGSGVIGEININVQATTAPGTDPVVPTAAGVVTVNGAAVANHSVVLETRSRAANAYNLEVQYATSAASTDATKSGVAHFDSAMFSVDASGFVTAGGTLATSYVEDSGSAVPSAGVLNIVGGTGISTSGSGSTVTISTSGSFTFTYTNVDHAASPYTVLSTDEYLSVDSSAGVVTLNFPNAPTFKKTWIIKDRTGSAATNNITLTTPGGTVTLDGQTSLIMDTNYMALNLIANSTPTYEVF